MFLDLKHPEIAILNGSSCPWVDGFESLFLSRCYFFNSKSFFGVINMSHTSPLGGLSQSFNSESESSPQEPVGTHGDMIAPPMVRNSTRILPTNAEVPLATESVLLHRTRLFAVGVSQSQCSEELKKQFNWQEGELREIRVMDIPNQSGILTAVVDGADAASKIIRGIPYGASVYCSLNPLNAKKYGLTSTKLSMCHKGEGVKDMDVVDRTCFVIDLDPIRPSTTSANEDQVAAARQLLDLVIAYLADHGWPNPTILASGNGFHAYVSCRLPGNSPLPARLLKVLSEKFSTDTVKVDTSVGNASRIMRCAGTWNAKGGVANQGNHRIAGIVSVGSGTVITEDHFNQVLNACEANYDDQTHLAVVDNVSQYQFDIDEWLERHGVANGGREDWPGGGIGAFRWSLTTCGFNPAHKPNKAVITQRGNGIVGYKCQHDSCSENGWKDFRRHIESAYVSPASTSDCGSRGEYPIHALPTIIRDAVELQVRLNAVDPAAIAVPLLVSFLGVVGASARVVVYEGWPEAFAAFALLIVPSGGMKSSTLGFCEEVLKQLELTFPMPLEEEPAQRLVTTDPTVEAMVKIISENPRGLIVLRDEAAGFFRSMGQYKSVSSGDEAFWLSAIEGKRHCVDRKTAGSYDIPCLTASFIGGIQPGVYRSIMTGPFIESGMAARFWCVMPLRKRQSFAIPDIADEQMIRALHFRMRIQMQSLRSIPISGPQLLIKCEMGAQELIVEYAKKQEEIIYELPDSSLERSFRSKSRGWVARIAGLIALLRCTHGVMNPDNVIDYSGVCITKEDMAAGIELVTWQVEENVRVVKYMKFDDVSGNIRRLDEVAHKALGGSKDGLTVRDLSRREKLDEKKSKELLDSLVSNNLWRREYRAISEKGGRPSASYFPLMR